MNGCMSAGCWHAGRWSHLAPDREEPGEPGTLEQEEAAVDPASAQTFTLLLEVSSPPPESRGVAHRRNGGLKSLLRVFLLPSPWLALLCRLWVRLRRDQASLTAQSED